MKKNKENVTKDENKESKLQKISYNLKKKVITNDTKTVLLVLIIIGIFIGLNLWVKSLNLMQIDVTKEKLYTLTDTSIKAIKNINKDIKIYVWGYTEDAPVVDLIKQYGSKNNKITYKMVSRDKNQDIVEKYNFEDDMPSVVIVTNEGAVSERKDFLYDTDFYSYDANFNQVDITEQKITNSILKINSEDIPTIYTLTNSGINQNVTIEYFKQCISYFGLYKLSDLDTTNAKKFEIPADADLVILPTLTSDLNKKVTDKIKEYINKGGNILIFNDINLEKEGKFPNYQEILDLYGIEFADTFVSEDEEHAIAGTDSYMFGTVSESSPVTRSVNTSPILFRPGIIVYDENKTNEAKVTVEPFLYSSTESTSKNMEGKVEDKNGNYIIGATLDKLVSDGVNSKAIIYSSQISFSDLSAVDLGDSTKPLFYGVEEIAMNSIAYLTDKGEYYSISKLNPSVISADTIITSEKQDTIIKFLMSALFVIVIVVGVIILVKRRK